MTDGILAIIMAGGAGERLQPLTRGAQRGGPFGGKFSAIDFTLSTALTQASAKFMYSHSTFRVFESPHPGRLGHLKRRFRATIFTPYGATEAWHGL